MRGRRDGLRLSPAATIVSDASIDPFCVITRGARTGLTNIIWAELAPDHSGPAPSLAGQGTLVCDQPSTAAPSAGASAVCSPALAVGIPLWDYLEESAGREPLRPTRRSASDVRGFLVMGRPVPGRV